jgi:hypothetical protein
MILKKFKENLKKIAIFRNYFQVISFKPLTNENKRRIFAASNGTHPNSYGI